MYIDSNSFINIMLQLNSNQDINENESGRCNQSHTLFVGARQQQMVPTISEMQHLKFSQNLQLMFETVLTELQGLSDN